MVTICRDPLRRLARPVLLLILVRLSARMTRKPFFPALTFAVRVFVTTLLITASAGLTPYSAVALGGSEHVPSGTQVAALGTVLSAVPYLDPTDRQVYTRAGGHLDVGVRGEAAGIIEVTSAGGVCEGVGQTDSADPRLKPGEQRIFFLSYRPGAGFQIRGGRAGAVRLSSPYQPGNTN